MASEPQLKAPTEQDFENLADGISKIGEESHPIVVKSDKIGELIGAFLEKFDVEFQDGCSDNAVEMYTALLVSKSENGAPGFGFALTDSYCRIYTFNLRSCVEYEFESDDKGDTPGTVDGPVGADPTVIDVQGKVEMIDGKMYVTVDSPVTVPTVPPATVPPATVPPATVPQVTVPQVKVPPTKVPPPKESKGPSRSTPSKPPTSGKGSPRGKREKYEKSKDRDVKEKKKNHRS